jgi:hypothetical protein
VSRRFNLRRKIDLTGVSGVGVIAHGCEFDDGSVALLWAPPHKSYVWWRSIADLEATHGHNGTTRVEWVDE